MDTIGIIFYYIFLKQFFLNHFKGGRLIKQKFPYLIPAGTVSVKCNIATGGYHLKNGGETGGFSTSLNFNYNDEPVPEQIISLPTPTPSGSLIVTGVSLEYYFNKNGHLQKSMNKAFMPAGIVSAMYI
jgi:hypothetical protein